MLLLALASGFGVTQSSATTTSLIPDDRRTNWTPGVRVGVPNGIPTRSRLIDVTAAPFSADKSGNTDAKPAIQKALESSSPNDVIYLPPGRYRLDSALYVTHNLSNRTIRGAGESTVVVLGPKSNFGYFGYNDAWKWDYPASGNRIPAGHPSLAQGSDILEIADTSAFQKGDLVRVMLENSDTLPVLHTSKASDMRTQLTRVVDVINSRQIKIFPPLYGDYRDTSARLASTRRYLSGFGIEDLFIDGAGSDGTDLISLEQTFGCWIKGVRVHKAKNRAILVTASIHFEMRECYVDIVRNIGNNGAGLLVGNLCASLIEDNIFYDAFPHIQANSGSAGNVIAYNFCELNYQGGVMGVSIDSNHGAHNHYNLYEGNIASKFQSDGYYGSASHDTLFRNWFHATCTNSDPAKSTNQFGIAVFLNRFTRSYNIVGNVLGRSGETMVQRYINVGEGGSFNGTSSTAHSVGLGQKTFQTQSGLDLVGCDVKAWSLSNKNAFMIGTVASYTGTTLVLNVYKANGSGTVSDWELRGARGTGYGERYMLSFGLPNLGNGGYSGMAELSAGSQHAWASWAPYLAASQMTGPGPGGWQEYDWDVYNTVLLRGNFNYATNNIPPSESIGTAALPASLYHTEKPTWFGSLDWPSFDPRSPENLSYEKIPAGYRFQKRTPPPVTPTSAPQSVRVQIMSQ